MPMRTWHDITLLCPSGQVLEAFAGPDRLMRKPVSDDEDTELRFAGVPAWHEDDAGNPTTLIEIFELVVRLRPVELDDFDWLLHYYEYNREWLARPEYKELLDAHP